MLNEEGYIGQCLDSVLSNDYPSDLLEVLVVDGQSTDRSREVVEGYAARYSSVRLLDNPRGHQAAALNIGIRSARHEIIIRMDAHAEYAADYVSCCVDLLEESGAANVGGVQRAAGVGYVASAIAAATSHAFGAGDAHFRYSDRQEWTESVYLGAWRRTTLDAVGGYNEEWLINEDYELNYRIRKAGGRILLSPRIRCVYWVRRSLGALARQYFRYGMWKVKTLMAHPGSLRWRQAVPPIFVLAVFGALVSYSGYPAFAITLALVYAVAAVAAALQLAAKEGWQYLPLLPIVFAVLHLSWGSGFWTGLVRFGLSRLGLGDPMFGVARS